MSKPWSPERSKTSHRRTARDRRAHSSRGTAERDTRTLRTGRLANVAGWTGSLRPRKPPLGARAQSAVVALMAACHSLRRWVPASRSAAPLHTPTSKKKGSDPFSEGLRLRTSPTLPPYVDFYTGERLAMGGTAIGSAPSCRRASSTTLGRSVRRPRCAGPSRLRRHRSAAAADPG